MDYTSLTVTGLILNPCIPVIGCTAVGIRSKTIEIKNIQFKINNIFIIFYFSGFTSNSNSCTANDSNRMIQIASQ